MKTALLRFLFVLFVALSVAAPVSSGTAACMDPPAPGVNWRRCYQDSNDLRNADLAGAMLRDATFQRADLSGANLAGADAYRGKFVSATMVGIVLDGARLIEADLTRADLTGASLAGADLRLAKLVNATLVKADLTGARLERTDFRHANLAGATWIDGKRICGENSIGWCN